MHYRIFAFLGVLCILVFCSFSFNYIEYWRTWIVRFHRRLIVIRRNVLIYKVVFYTKHDSRSYHGKGKHAIVTDKVIYTAMLERLNRPLNVRPQGCESIKIKKVEYVSLNPRLFVETKSLISFFIFPLIKTMLRQI